MSEIDNESRPQKTKEDYSRNVKKLKLKLNKVQNEILTLQKKIETIQNTSNDKLISLKIAKFCKERRITPQMLFRFADKKSSKTISKIDFQATLTQIGLKLTKEQFMRLQYLIDEDLSGEISYQEYNKYIDAFGIKKQFTKKDLAMKQIFNKINFQQILKITNQDDNNNKNNNKQNRTKHQNLLNYQQFIKYCHKNFPQLKNKQLASIFNRLQRNQLISIRDLIDYIKGQADEKKMLESKNKKRIKKNQSLIQEFGDQDTRSLINVIKTLVKYRVKNSNNGLFHSAEFLRLERILNTKRGQLLSLFKQIDKKHIGSFSYNQLISYYIDKQQQNKAQLFYTFELMGSKLRSNNQKVQDLLFQYTEDQQYITQQQLKKLFQEEFQIKNNRYQLINKLIQYQNNKISISKILQLFKFVESRIIYVRPNLITNKLIFKSGLQALRCCLQIQKKMNDVKISQWHDYQFGPGLSDQFGIDSIGLPLPYDTIDWFRTEQLGMIQFYKQEVDNVYSCGSICPHDVLVKSLYNLIENNQEALFSNKSNLKDNLKDIQQQNLKPLFSGIYPLAFHYFSKYGMYILKLFIHQKWRYILIDNKIPCSNDKKPFFLHSKNMRYSYFSLIQKAYAKYHGNYKNIYDINDHNKYIIELSNMLAIEIKLQKNMNDDIKNYIWKQLVKEKIQNQKINKKQSGNKEYKERVLYCVLKNKKERQLNIQLMTQKPYKIKEFVELEDAKSKNTHKSHRLILMSAQKEIQNESQWNVNWNRTQTTNKYAMNGMALSNKFTQPSILKNKKNLLINYKLLRSNFNFFKYHQINYKELIILRKQLEFEQKIKCRYELSSKNDLQFIIVLNPIIQSTTDNKITLDIKNQKEQIIQHNIYKDFIINHVYLMKNSSLNIQLYLDNWKTDVSLRYNLSFYMLHPRYQLKQRDRHMLFRFVSPYQEQSKIQFSHFQTQEKQFIYKQFYRSAQRRGCFGCC